MPCALVVSIPLGFFAGSAVLTRQGILVKEQHLPSGRCIARTIVFDKTGTLTSGQFSVEEIAAVPPFSREEVLELAARAERNSTHPIAQSILRAYGREVDDGEITSVQEQSGFGVKAHWRGREILVGSRQLLEQAGIEAPADLGRSGVHVAVDGHYAGAIVLADAPKAHAARAVSELKVLVWKLSCSQEIAQQWRTI